MLSYHEECIATVYGGVIVAGGNTGKFSATIRTKNAPPSPKSRSATGCVSTTVAVKSQWYITCMGILVRFSTQTVQSNSTNFDPKFCSLFGRNCFFWLILWVVTPHTNVKCQLSCSDRSWQYGISKLLWWFWTIFDCYRQRKISNF